MVIFHKCRQERFSNPQFRIRHNRLPIGWWDKPEELITKVIESHREIKQGNSVVYNVKGIDSVIRDFVITTEGIVRPLLKPKLSVEEVIEYAYTAASK